MPAAVQRHHSSSRTRQSTWLVALLLMLLPLCCLVLDSSLVSGGLSQHVTVLDRRTGWSPELLNLSATTGAGIGQYARRHFQQPTVDVPPLSIASARHGAGSPPAAVVSLRDACHREILEGCGGKPNPLRCVLVMYYGRAKMRFIREPGDPSGYDAVAVSPLALPVFSSTCTEWLAAREACVTFLHAHTNIGGHTGSGFSCPLSLPPRDCLRRAAAELLPPACRNSDYYLAALQAGRLAAAYRSETTPRQLP